MGIVHASTGCSVGHMLLEVLGERKRVALKRWRDAIREEAFDHLVDVSLLVQSHRPISVVASLDAEEVNHWAFIEHVPITV